MINRIVLEGVDKVGKNTLEKYISFITNHKYYTQSRSEISYIIYDKWYKRNTDLIQFKQDDNTLYVLLRCSNLKELEYRIKFDEYDKKIDDVIKQQGMYLEFFLSEIKGNNKLILDISNKTLPQMAEEIICKIEIEN